MRNIIVSLLTVPFVLLTAGQARGQAVYDLRHDYYTGSQDAGWYGDYADLYTASGQPGRVGVGGGPSAQPGNQFGQYGGPTYGRYAGQRYGYQDGTGDLLQQGYDRGYQSGYGLGYRSGLNRGLGQPRAQLYRGYGGTGRYGDDSYDASTQLRPPPEGD